MGKPILPTDSNGNQIACLFIGQATDVTNGVITTAGDRLIRVCAQTDIRIWVYPNGGAKTGAGLLLMLGNDYVFAVQPAHTVEITGSANVMIV